MENIRAISSELQIRDDGIWYSSESQSISYPSDGNDNCFAVEDNSFWFRHRNKCIISVVKSYPPEDNGTIFDLGGGNGFVSLGLANAGFDVVLVEPGYIGASNGKKRGLKNVICATTETAKFAQHSLSAVGLFDVIEHIDDDIAFLRSIRFSMKKGAYLYVTVPAFSFLWSDADVLAGHFRRYTLNSICDALKSSGFQIEFSSYIFRFLPIPIFFLRSLPHKFGFSKRKRSSTNISRTHAVKNGLFARLIKVLFKSEINSLKNKRAMCFGGSCLIVAKSP